MSPITDLFSPFMDLVYGPARMAVTSPKLKIYPMFGPLTTCFFSKTHAPFTIVLNDFDRYSYLNYINTVNRSESLDQPLIDSNSTEGYTIFKTSTGIPTSRSLQNGKYKIFTSCTFCLNKVSISLPKCDKILIQF